MLQNVQGINFDFKKNIDCETTIFLFLLFMFSSFFYSGSEDHSTQKWLKDHKNNERAKQK